MILVGGTEEREDRRREPGQRRSGVVVADHREEAPDRLVLERELQPRELAVRNAGCVELLQPRSQAGTFAHHRHDGVVCRERFRHQVSCQLVGERVALLPRGRDAGPRIRDHERDGNASRGCFDDDPAALAVAEQPEGEAGRTVRFEDGERGEKIVGLLVKPRFQPASGRAADPALVERADGDPRSEQVLSDRREEHVVVPVGRPRAGMHEHTRHRVPGGTPQRSSETDASGVRLDLEPRPKGVLASRHFEDGSD